MKKKANSLIDLSIGNPSFLFDYWSRLHNILDREPNAPIAEEATCVIQAQSDMDYTDGPQESLQHAIIDLHKAAGNINIDGKYIVVGTGATQVLHAAIYALNSTAQHLIIKPPYWYRFSDMARLHALSMVDVNTLYGADDVKVIITPNNPDGTITPISGDGNNTIYDLSYHWPQYTENLQEGCPRIGVFSLAKATGHAGSRIGWAVVDAEWVAGRMNDYIEHSTGGVSVDAQKRATGILKMQVALLNSNLPDLTCFAEGARVLKYRWNIINQMKNTLPFQVLNNSGMFLWCKVLRGNGAGWAQQELKIESLAGTKCGLTEEYFRVNIGCTVSDFTRFIDRLKNYK